MKFNRKTLFKYLRNAPLGGKLTQQQVDGIEDVLDYIEKRPNIWKDIRWIAYFFATVQHETAGTMQPVRETLAKTAAQAVARLENAFNAGRLRSVRTPYWRTDKDGLSWHGRGRVQLTHKSNYEFAENKTGIPLTTNPELMLKSAIDVRVSAPGTLEGWWTRGNHTLERWFNSQVNDPVNARRIVNGTDKANHIAENLYYPWLSALQAAETTTPQPPDVLVDDPASTPDGKKASESTTVYAAVGTALAGGGASVFAAIDNPYALGFAVVCVVCAAWIIRERMRHAYEKGV